MHLKSRYLRGSYCNLFELMLSVDTLMLLLGKVTNYSNKDIILAYNK